MTDKETTVEIKEHKLLIAHWQATANHYAEEVSRLHSAYIALQSYRKWQWSVTIIESIKCAAICIIAYVAYRGIL